MKPNLKLFIIKIVVLYTIVLTMSLIIYFFSKHNLISDYTAKIFISNFSKKNLVIKKEIAEERRVVYQNIAKNKNKHFNYLIIGSSRVMQFGKLTGFQNSLNLGVSGAGLNDIKYIYKLTKENKSTYDTIIFDFNPWLVLKEQTIDSISFSLSIEQKTQLKIFLSWIIILKILLQL
jgi:hypothetical protein